MSLTKDDLQQIEKIVGKSAESTKKELLSEINSSAKFVTEKLRSDIGEAKKEIIDILGREVSDLADINRAVITRTDELDYRLRIVERKLGLKAH